MNMNFKFLFLGTSLSLIPNITYAQCTVTDCQQLGYTSLKSCDGGLKCPFGEYWACPCDEAYKYTCTGTNEQPGTDKCGDKYKSCTCTSGYEWKDGKCQTKGAVLGQCTGYAQNCSIGQLLNSDGTCTTDKVYGKTPVGIVIAIKDNCGWAMTASPIATNIEWSTESNSTGAFQSYDWQQAIKDFDVSGNMTKIIQTANGNSRKYPAAYAALNYAPSAAPATKGKWMLPTAGILGSLYTNLNAIKKTISKIGGTQDTNDKYIWSSTERNASMVWVFIPYAHGAGEQGGLGYGDKYNPSDSAVRPVLAF